MAGLSARGEFARAIEGLLINWDAFLGLCLMHVAEGSGRLKAVIERCVY